jgi:hypothetical protein
METGTVPACAPDSGNFKTLEYSGKYTDIDAGNVTGCFRLTVAKCMRMKHEDFLHDHLQHTENGEFRSGCSL